ncbi:MAG: VWA domain-containing protein, partial [Treponema sp.]|nr:VWA domain-containing protein [Treponema sp.]
MKKAVFLLILVLGIVTGVFCQTPGSANQSGPMDLVVVLDTSASMSNYYQGTSDYLIGPFLKEFLRIGDTFHLISFAETPKVEISRLIEGVGDVEAVIGRLLLMYPLAAQSDVAGAMNYAEKYSSSLPGSRHKKIILITDGDAPGTQTLVTTASAVLKSQGADLQYIKVPVTGTGPSSGRPAGTAPVKTAPAAQTAQSTPKTQTSQPGTTVQTTQPPTSQPAQSTGSAAAPSRPAAQPVQPPAQVQSQPPQTTQAPRPTTQAVPPSQGGTSAVLPPPQTSQGIAPPTSQGTVPGTGYSTVTPSTVIPSTVIPPPSTPQTVPPSTVTGLASGETQQPPVTAAGGIPQTTAPETGTNQPYQGQSAESPAPQYPAQPVQPQVQVPVQTAPQPSPDSGTGYSGDIPLPLIIGLAILALLLLGLLILFAARRL